MLAREGLNQSIMVDCSHANSGKDHNRLEEVLANVCAQIACGNRSIRAVMIESFLEPGNQPIPEDLSQLKYGVSVTENASTGPPPNGCCATPIRCWPAAAAGHADFIPSLLTG